MIILFVEFPGHGISEDFRMNDLTADPAPNKFKGDHLVPFPFQQIFEFDRFLRAYPPTITAPSASGHIVKQSATIADITGIKSIGRTVLNAGQAAVAFVIDPKVRHSVISLCRYRLKQNGASGNREYVPVPHSSAISGSKNSRIEGCRRRDCT